MPGRDRRQERREALQHPGESEGLRRALPRADATRSGEGPGGQSLKLFQELVFADPSLAQHPLRYHVVKFDAVVPNQSN